MHSAHYEMQAALSQLVPLKKAVQHEYMQPRTQDKGPKACEHTDTLPTEEPPACLPKAMPQLEDPPPTGKPASGALRSYKRNNLRETQQGNSELPPPRPPPQEKHKRWLLTISSRQRGGVWLERAGREASPRIHLKGAQTVGQA